MGINEFIKQKLKKLTYNSKKCMKVKSCKMQKHTESSDDSEDENTSCIFYKEKYSDPKEGEGWIMCASCKDWAHEACSGVDLSLIHI